MMSRRRVVCQTLVVLVLGFAHPGCGSSIAARYPHLERRAVCVRVPGVESDASEYLVTDAGEGISNFHPEVVDRIAPDARTVFEFDPGAEPDSVRHLPAPYNQLQCGAVFSILPSKDAEIPPLPTAAVDLLVHERRPEVVPEALAERLARCAQLSPGSFAPKQHTMALNVYVRRDGRVVSAYVAQSTLGERKTEACVVNVLRNTSWPGVVDEMTAASDVASSEGVKLFLSEPARTLPQPDTGPISEIRPKVQPTPASNPGGPRMTPRIFVIPLGPVLVAIAAFGIIFFYTEDDAPAWTSEINPITKQPYTSKQEYDQIQQMTPDQIREAQKQITNAQAKPPAPAPPPAPMPPPAAGARKYPNQTCTNEEMARFEDEMHRICDIKYAVSCGGDHTKPKFDNIPCSAVKLSIQQRQACVAARWVVQDKCFGGKPNDEHKKPIDDHQRGIDNCEALKLKVCAKGHPMAEK